MIGMSQRSGAVLAVILCIAVAPAAFAQIDKRVNTGNANSGRLHDANPGVGSGGINLARPAYDLGGRSDAIITGNVSGLGRFQGGSPLLQNNAFRASLGSTALSDFQRQSVGIADVLSNRTMAPTYFYDTQRTIPDINDIRRGLTQPGSSTLYSTSVTPLRGGGQVESPLNFGLRDPVDRRTFAPGGLDPSQRSIPSPSPMGISPLYFDRAAGSSIFGPPQSRPGIYEQLAERRAARREAINRMSNDLQRSRLEDELALRDAGRLNPPVTTPAPVAVGESMPPSIASIQVSGDDDAPDAPGVSGGNRFNDMIGAIRAAQAAGRPLLGFSADGAVPSGEAEPVAPADDKAASPDAGPTRVDFRRERGRRIVGLTEKSSDAAIASASAAQWAGLSLDDPIASFAIANSDKMNQYMEEGEEALREGRYFDASRHFDMAAVMDPRNPLPLLARGHALAAAGNYMSAVNSLSRGLTLFPQITAFKLDLPAMVGQSDVFDRRRAELERRLSNREDRELRFLLGYLELYSGLTDLAQKNLTLAAKASPEGSIIARFPDLVFGRIAIPVLK